MMHIIATKHCHAPNVCARLTRYWNAARPVAIWLIVCHLTFTPAILQGQSAGNCHTQDQIEAESWMMPDSLFCIHPKWTYPDTSFGYQSMPISVVKLWFHFLRPQDGSGIHAGDQGANSAAHVA
ncbi:MAG TPA: hypothetical protein PKY96_04700, partial [Flavobacteriales bacterium]|nr:hypothetical protein [Flavobacteriales bacterium]